MKSVIPFLSSHQIHDPENEIDLYETSREREIYENCADLYAIIIATEHLERAFSNNAITHKEYLSECNKLIAQFKMAEKAALGKKMKTEDFMKFYHMDCPRATERLLNYGIPAQVKSSNDEETHVAVTVAETVQYFITAMDAVALEKRAVDELQPLLSDLLHALTRLPETPNDFEPNRQVEKWLMKLNAMRAVEEIDEDDARQLSHDLDSTYAEFTRYLKGKR